MTSTATLEFTAEGVDTKPYAFASSRNNQRAKIVLAIDALVQSDNMDRLRAFVQALTWMLQAQPILEESLDIVPLVVLESVAKFGNKDTVRGVIGQVLQRLNLSTDTVGKMVVLDWSGAAIESIRLSIARMGDPSSISTQDVVPFSSHSLWILLTDEANQLASAHFSIPVPSDPEEFTAFVNDVVGIAPSAESQNAIVSAFNLYYASHPIEG